MFKDGGLDTGNRERPRLSIEQAIPQDVIDSRTMQAKSWRATYPNESAGVSKDWVYERTEKWLEPEALEKSVDILANILSDPKQFYRLAKIGKQTIGFVHVNTKNDNTTHLEAIYVDPEHFGSGVGATLMDEAISWINGKQMTLEVASYNERAIKFYQKYGFKIVPNSEHMYEDIMPIVDMLRKATK